MNREMFNDLLSALRNRATTERLHICGLLDDNSAKFIQKDLEKEIEGYYVELCQSYPDELVVSNIVQLYKRVELERDIKWKSVA